MDMIFFKKSQWLEKNLNVQHIMQMYPQDITTWKWNFMEKLMCSSKLHSWRLIYMFKICLV